MDRARGYLSPRECAAEVGVSKMTVYRLCENGILPYYRIGRSIRIRRADWLNYLANQRHEIEEASNG